jgi:hypothetical protein
VPRSVLTNPPGSVGSVLKLEAADTNVTPAARLSFMVAPVADDRPVLVTGNLTMRFAHDVYGRRRGSRSVRSVAAKTSRERAIERGTPNELPGRRTARTGSMCDCKRP